MTEPLARAPLRVVYIMGVGRSGSTVLDSLLGNHPQIESVGELSLAADRGWLRNEYCSCGKPARECSRWSAIRHVWSKLVGHDDAAAFARLVESIDGGHLASLRLPLVRRCRRERFARYARESRALFEAIQRVSGKPVVVESSKRMARAAALAAIPGMELSVIHLVRDGRGVAWSLQKKFGEDPRRGLASLHQPHRAWRAATIWMSGNLQSAWVRRRLPPERSIRLRYEDFVTQPRAALEQIGRLVGLDMGPLTEAVDAGREFPVGHSIAGNRLRLAGPVRLRADNEWTEKLSPRDERVCWSMAGWLLRRYGYERAA